jgi:hypothetical protein
LALVSFLSLLSTCLPTQAQTTHAWNVTCTNNGTFSYADRDQPTTGQSTPHTPIWPPTSNGEGGGSSTEINGNSQGKVTATLTWTPATGKTLLTDPPPSPVTIIEYGHAWESSISAPGPAGSADDGLGDMEIPASSGFVSQGFHALPPQDGSSGTITVVSPLLKAINPVSTWVPVPNYPGYHYWDWTGGECTASFTVYPVTVTVLGTTPAGGSKALTGQQLTAMLNLPGGFSVVQPTGQTGYQWTIVGNLVNKVFKNYDPTLPSNQLTLLTATDLKAVSPSFYDSAAETVNATCTVILLAPDGITQIPVTVKSKDISVLKPTVTAWGITGGIVRV